MRLENGVWVMDEMPKFGAPGLVTQGWSVLKATTRFITDGCKLVDAVEYTRRLAICETCPRREGGRCLECGCHLAIKAQARVFECPLKFWEQKSPGEN